jgi:hypothetical protein
MAATIISRMIQNPIKPTTRNGATIGVATSHQGKSGAIPDRRSSNSIIEYSIGTTGSLARF